MRGENSLQQRLVLAGPSGVDHDAGKRQVLHVIDGQSKIVEPCRLGLKIVGRQQNRGINRAGEQRRGARDRGTGKDHIELARLDAVRLQHALDINARDVFWAAERDDLALELLEALDGRLGKQGVWRRLNFDPYDCNRRAHSDRAHRVDKAGRYGDIERSGRNLLNHRSARLHVKHIELHILRCKEPFLHPDENRPEIRRWLPHRADRNRVCRPPRRRRYDPPCQEKHTEDAAGPTMHDCLRYRLSIWAR